MNFTFYLHRPLFVIDADGNSTQMGRIVDSFAAVIAMNKRLKWFRDR